MTSRNGLYDPARALQRPSCASTGFAAVVLADHCHDRHQDRLFHRRDRRLDHPYAEHRHQELTGAGTNRHQDATGCNQDVSLEHQQQHPEGHQDEHQDHQDELGLQFHLDVHQGRQDGHRGQLQEHPVGFHPEVAELGVR
jgi:hypothetical protein